MLENFSKRIRHRCFSLESNPEGPGTPALGLSTVELSILYGHTNLRKLGMLGSMSVALDLA